MIYTSLSLVVIFGFKSRLLKVTSLKKSYIYIIPIWLLFLFGCKPSPDVLKTKIDKNCICDTTKAIRTFLSRDYLHIAEYDSDSFAPDSLYSLTQEKNRDLWFRDIESPNKTKFTPYWNSYNTSNYLTNNKDFIEYYSTENEDVELAFQIGPLGFLWGYYSFVVKKVDCCYGITNSAFVHGRFRHKSHAVVDHVKIQELRNLLNPFINDSLQTNDDTKCKFIDVPNQKIFFVPLEDASDTLNNFTKSGQDILNFIQDSIPWTTTYNP